MRGEDYFGGNHKPLTATVSAYDPDVTVVSTSNEDGSKISITVSGEADNGSYDSLTFGSVTQAATELDIIFEDIDTSASYVIEQENPALKMFTSDSTISGTTKTKTYAGSDMSGNKYQLLLVNGGTPVTVKLYKVGESGNELIQTVTITNNVTIV